MEIRDLPADVDPATLVGFAASLGHNKAVGLKYHAHGDRWCEMAMPWQADLAGDGETGILASGPIFTLMDMATSVSIWLALKRFQPQATLDMRIDYLRPATPGETVYGRGECYHLTRTVAFVRGQAHDGDPNRPIAHVAGTYFFTDAG